MYLVCVYRVTLFFNCLIIELRSSYTTNHQGGLSCFPGLIFVFLSAYDVDTYEMYCVYLLLCKIYIPPSSPRDRGTYSVRT